MTQPLILVTGASGFLGTHVVRTLQSAGHRVRGTVRSTNDLKKIQHLYELCPDAKHKLELVEADLNNAESWKAAVQGCTYVHHVASPFSIGKPKDENEVIRPAVDGTVSVLKACVGDGNIKRVVLTSSAIAIGHTGGNTVPLTEKDWCDLSTGTAYAKSKHLAEKAAWDFIKELPDEQKFELAVINPTLIIGPTLHGSGGASMDIVRQIVTKMPLVPMLNMGVIDVRNVAEAHLNAMTVPEAAGNRHILHNRTVWLPEVARCLAKEFNPQGFKVSTWTMPQWAIWLMSFFSSEMAVMYDAGRAPTTLDNSRMQKVLGINPIPMDKSLVDMVYSMVEKGYLDKPPQYKGPQN